jgi:hypothetical protein
VKHKKASAERWLSLRSSIGLSVLTMFGALGAIWAGICPCTPYTLSSISLVLLSALLVGNRGFEALTSEREKKTLDCLRLTQLTADQVLYAKIFPELVMLSRLLLVLAPTVLLTSVLSDAGMGRGVAVVAVSIVAGLMSSTMALAISSLSSHTSRAVVAGWGAKFVWLALTSVFDQVVAAVRVSDTSAPIFDSLNPLAAVGVLVLPDAQQTALRTMVPAFFLFAGLGAALIFWKVAARRFDSGMVASARLTDRRVHSLYSNRPGKSGLLSRVPGVQSNPVLARELVSQLRSGAGTWPGYLVFLVLLLAPFFYTDSWAVKREMQSNVGESGAYQMTAPVQVSSYSEQTGSGSAEPTLAGVHFVAADGIRLLLKDHTPNLCFRLLAHQVADVPLPMSEVVQVSVPSWQGSASNGTAALEQPVDHSEAVRLGLTKDEVNVGEVRSLDTDRLHTIHLQSIQIGLLFALTILLAYLTVRLSGSTATAVTSEIDRRSWSDLALAGVTPRQFLSGKLVGALLLPLWQMSVAFPAILFFVAGGALGLFEAIGLYVYVVGLAVLAGVTGIWSSVVSKNSQQAQGRALTCVFYGSIVTLGLMALGPVGVLACAGLLAWVTRVNERSSFAALGVFIVSGLLVSASLSPATAALSFLPSLSHDGRFDFLRSVMDPDLFAPLSWLCAIATQSSLTYLLWNSAVRRLSDQSAGESLRADLAA